MAERRQERRGTAAAWTAANPVLASGEWGYQTDGDKVVKIGDGVTAWADLEPALSATYVSVNEDGDLVFAGDILEIGGGGTVAVYDVRDYGAVLDNTTNDAPAIQAAIDACAAAGGGVVYISGQAANGSSTRCKINTTLRMKTGVWLRGAGPSTVLTGTASPMIALPTSGTAQDRMTISDLFLQSPAGVGVHLDASGMTGSYQLGWPRVTIQNVTVADAVSHAFQIVNSAVIESRWINCVSLRASGHGFLIGSTDNFLWGCTAAAGTSASFNGFEIQGGNNKLSVCKSYGNLGNGFDVAGSGRHMLTSCEAQDNGVSGYLLSGSWNTLSACLADTNRQAGFHLDCVDSALDACVVTTGGGGSGYVTRLGFRFGSLAARNRVSGIAGSAYGYVGGRVEGNAVQVKTAGDSQQTLAYAAAVTPDPYLGSNVRVTLTGNITVNNPTAGHVGQELTLDLRQDATGGRTVTLGDAFRTATGFSWSTTANEITRATFHYDGRSWVQRTGSGITARPAAGVTDSFTRANGALGTADTGQAWSTFGSGGNTWQIIGNAAGIGGGPNFQRNLAWLEAGRADGIVKVSTNQPGTSGLVWRVTDSGNYYQWVGNGISKVVAGSEISIATGITNLASGSFVVLDGPTWHLYTPAGVLIGSYVDTTTTAPYLTQTKHGMTAQVSTDRLDDFSFV